MTSPDISALRETTACEQRGRVQCSVCDRWFRNTGGLTMHHWGQQLDTSSTDDSTTTIQLRRRPGFIVAVTAQRLSSQEVLCAECGRRFSQPGDLKGHKLLIERAKPIEQLQDAVQCGGCQIRSGSTAKGVWLFTNVKEKTLVHSNYAL